MIFIPHLLLGAAIGSIIKYPLLAIILAFLSHYILDFLPHTDYTISNIKKKQWKKTGSEFSIILFDIIISLITIAIISSNQPIIYICALFAILPDGLTALGLFIKNKFLHYQINFHRKEVHYFKEKKIPNFWRTFSQIFITIVAVILLAI